MVREREFTCIEIDLSKIPRNISMQELEGKVVGDGPDPAPRKWLSHPRGERKDAELRHERKREFTRRMRTAVRKLKVPGSWIGRHCGPMSHQQYWCIFKPLLTIVPARVIDCIYCDNHIAHFTPAMKNLMSSWQAGKTLVSYIVAAR